LTHQIKPRSLLKHNTLTNDFNRLPAVTKLLIAFGMSTLSFFLLLLVTMEWITRVMICWDVFSDLLSSP